MGKTIEDARAAARMRWKRLTPYKLGYFVAYLGISCPSPYRERSRGEYGYQEGLYFGAMERERDAARAKERT